MSSSRSRPSRLGTADGGEPSSDQPPTLPQQQQQNQTNDDNNNTPANNPEGDEAENAGGVTPELLVDALSGHEDGLLAIAERLMERYGDGYDAMGEAIIDAFADVQKLFQHVVEAAHMEGAAFESSRRESEDLAKKEQQLTGNDGNTASSPTANPAPKLAGGGTPIVRHEEYIDQDVKDVLNEAIQLVQTKRAKPEVGLATNSTHTHTQHHMECYEIYERACQSASSLLPVDSDHRGRLQLSIARAESMSPDRACSILRYAMDDVLRSGLRPNAAVEDIIDEEELEKRNDSVLTKRKSPKKKKHSDRGRSVSPSLSQHSFLDSPTGGGHGHHGPMFAQSSEEVLNSLIEEMKDSISAPVYDRTPIRNVAKRFWRALEENEKMSVKKRERIENSLAALKGDFLLARAEWEEKLADQTSHAESSRQKYAALKDQVHGHGHGRNYNDRSNMNPNKLGYSSGTATTAGASSSDGNGGAFYASDIRLPIPNFSVGGSNSHSHSHNSPSNTGGGSKSTPSVASIGSGLAQHARSIADSFSCIGVSDRKSFGGNNGRSNVHQNRTYSRSPT